MDTNVLAQSRGAALAACLGLAVLLTAPVGAASPPATAASLSPDNLTMQAATDYALAHNPELLGMAQDVRMAAANVRLARAADRLQASIHAYGTSATDANMVGGPMDVTPSDMRMIAPRPRAAGDVRLTQLLSSGGRVSSRIRERRHLLAATTADLATLRLTVYYETRAAYRRALLRQKLVEVYQRDVDARQELTRVDEVKLEAGKIPLYYYLRDKSRLAAAQQQLVNAQRDLEVAYYDLSVTMGLPEPRELSLRDDLGYVPPDQEADGALTAAAANRPELAAMRERLAAAAAGMDQARAAYRPQVIATVILDAMTGGGAGATGGYTAALVAGLPLLDGGLRKAEVAAAEARQQQLGERERLLALGIAREVRVALADLKAADTNTRTALEARAAAEEDYRITRLRYDAGKAINLEPLDALAALVAARVNEAQALYAFNDAVDELNRAMGQPALPPGPVPAPVAAEPQG